MSDDSISLPTQLQQDSGFIFSEKSGCNNGEQFFCFQLNSFYQFVLFIKMASGWGKLAHTQGSSCGQDETRSSPKRLFYKHPIYGSLWSL